MLRGINGQNIFLKNSDYVCFCLLLQEACERHSLVVHAFCFMTNHLHLVLEPLKDSFQEGIHSFKWPLEDLALLLNKNSGTLSRLATRAEKLPELVTLCEKNTFHI